MWSAVLAFVVAAGSLAAKQTDSFKVITSTRADVHQETLLAVDPQSKQTTEAFPGTLTSAIGATVMSRVEAIMGRVDDADRDALVASRALAGFDRSIVSWRADAAGSTVALAVRYYRQPLFDLALEITDDYGRADPVDPYRYEFLAVAVCRRDANTWKCDEQPIADAAAPLKLTLPQDRAERMALAEKLVELLLAKK